MRVVVTFVSGTCDPGWVSLCGQFALRVNALQTSSLFQSDRFFCFFLHLGLFFLTRTVTERIVCGLENENDGNRARAPVVEL